MSVVLVNALVPPKDGGWLLVEPSSLYEVESAIARSRGNVESFIGHLATAKILGVAVNRGEYSPRPDDTVFVIRLRKRQSKPGGDAEVFPEDLEVFWVRYFVGTETPVREERRAK